MATSIAVFKGKEIRKTIHKDQWWFSVSDVVEALDETTRSGTELLLGYNLYPP
jgi:DNA-damage-inducible protein D